MGFGALGVAKMLLWQRHSVLPSLKDVCDFYTFLPVANALYIVRCAIKNCNNDLEFKKIVP
jgi:hypothetical protein